LGQSGLCGVKNKKRLKLVKYIGDKPTKTDSLDKALIPKFGQMLQFTETGTIAALTRFAAGQTR